MVILFAPSEGKREGGDLPALNPQSLIFPELYSQRLGVMEQYEKLVREGSDETLSELFGLKEPREFIRYKTPLGDASTMKAVLRYDGVAYDYLDYPALSSKAQSYIDQNVIVFSNLFGPVRAGDSLPDYKLKQGQTIGTFAPEKHYKAFFTAALDEWIGDREVLDIRAGFYDRFYTPANRPVTLKFLKEGKAVSHWAKAYRGIVLREAARHNITTIGELLSLDIEGLMLQEIIETKKNKEVVYTII